MVKPIPDGAMFLRASAGYIHSLLAQGFVDNQLSTLPQGHNQPVVVATGLLGPKASVNQLIRFLQKHDYAARRINVGIHLPSRREEPMYGRAFARAIAERHINTGKKVQVIGWSLGGLVAKLYALDHPEHLAAIHTIASPFQNALESSYLAYLQPFFRAIGRNQLTQELNEKLQQELAIPHYAHVATYDELVDPKLCAGKKEFTRYYDAGHLEIGYRPDMYAQIIRDIATTSKIEKNHHPIIQLSQSLDDLDRLLAA